MSVENINVDNAEIDKFAGLASRWWDPQGEFRSLHEINPLRLEFIKRQAPICTKQVLDVGCGGGILSESMALAGAQVCAIDMAQAPLKVARLHALEAGVNIDYRQITAEQLAAEMPTSFDVVTCMEMLEHVPKPASVITACAQLVKPGGHVFFSTLNRNPKSFLLAIVGAEYVLNLLPKGTHHYGKFIRPAELDHWNRQAGLKITELTGMHYNPLAKTYRLGDGVDINYLAAAIKY